MRGSLWCIKHTSQPLCTSGPACARDRPAHLGVVRVHTSGEVQGVVLGGLTQALRLVAGADASACHNHAAHTCLLSPGYNSRAVLQEQMKQVYETSEKVGADKSVWSQCGDGGSIALLQVWSIHNHDGSWLSSHNYCGCQQRNAYISSKIAPPTCAWHKQFKMACVPGISSKHV